MLSFVEKNRRRRPLREILPLPMPLGLCIEPTNRCNFRCVQCPVSLPSFKEIAGPLGHMDMGLYAKILDDIHEMGQLKNLNLYGDGEPLLNPDLLGMVRMAKERDVSEVITITTNASLIDEGMAEELVRSGLDYLRVSIYGVRPERFAQITQSRLRPERIAENMRTLRRVRDRMGSERPFLYVKMINSHSEEEALFLKEYGEIADEANLECAMNWNGYDGIDLISRIDPDRRTNETMQQGYHTGLTGSRSGEKRICTTPFLSLNIKRDGEACICIVDWNKGTSVGDLRHESLAQVWHGERLRAFREMHIRGRQHENVSCANCKFMHSTPDSIDDHPKEFYQRILGPCASEACQAVPSLEG